MGLDAIETQIKYIESMYVEIDTEYIADVITIRKNADIRIGAGVSLALVARDKVHIEPGVVVRSVGLEGKPETNSSSGDRATNNDKDGGRGQNGQAGLPGSAAGNFIICTTHLEFEQDMERFFHVALVGGKAGMGGLFWLNLVESPDNKIIVEKIPPPILIEGDGDEGEFKITFSPTFSDVMKKLSNER